MALVSETANGAEHGIGESVRREFVLPVLGVEVLLNLANERIAVSPQCSLWKIIIEKRDADIFRHGRQVELLQLSQSDEITLAVAKLVPFIRGHGFVLEIVFGVRNHVNPLVLFWMFGRNR